MIKYLIYCRKSRDEKDRQVLSIEAQIAELKEFAQTNHLEITEIIEEAKTAKVPGREKFDTVIKKIEKGEVNGILSWHPDRLARNSIDGGKIIYLLDTGKLLDLKFPTFWFENTPQGKFMLSIAFGQSKYYIDNLSENVKRGLRQKLRNGVLPAMAPLGYLNDPKVRSIEVDREKVMPLIKAFELFSLGNKSFTEIAECLSNFGIRRKNGKPLHINQIRRVLGNKFYIGVIKYNHEMYEGKHECFISKELFKKVQEELIKRDKHYNWSHGFPFLGIAKCGECGAAITAEQHQKFYQTTNRKVNYIYYRCTKKLGPCRQKYILPNDLEPQLRKVISDVSLPESWGNKWFALLEKDEILENQKKESNIARLKLEIERIDQKLNILLDSFLDGVIESEMYKQKKNELFEQKVKLNEDLEKVKTNGSCWLEPMRKFTKDALELEKIAAAKNNFSDLAIGAKTVGSNFFLTNRHLFVRYKGGFQTLWLNGGSQSFRDPSAPDSLSVGERRIGLRLPDPQPGGLPLHYSP